MPYAVTTTEHDTTHGVWSITSQSRRAVATLDEARDYADDICRGIPHQPGEIGEWLLAMDSFPESGGTVGPLPDGTVIEVEHVSWPELGWKAGVGELPTGGFDPSQPTSKDTIIDAYNAAQEVTV